MSKGMILSVGGSIEPLMKSICETQPLYVALLCSEGTLEKAVEIKRACQQQEFPVEVKYFPIGGEKSHEDLMLCYEQGLECSEWIKQKVQPHQVIVDYTGGTKNMTAALVLATVKENFNFSYVGGDKRNKEGLGVVESGSETVYTFENPWRRLAETHQQRLESQFNSYQYKACHLELKEIIKDLSDSRIRTQFEILNQVSQAYEAWDRFEHTEAIKFFKAAELSLSTARNLKASGFLESLADTFLKNFETLKTLTGLKTDIPDSSRADDLYANAQRRFKEHKYDDAVARLYRLIEMLGQIELYKKTQQLTGKFPIERLPASLKEEYIADYQDREKPENVKLGLYATFKLLNVEGHEIGKLFQEHEKQFKTLMQSRNSSILAHGNLPLKEELAKRFFEFVKTIYQPKSTLEFPKLVFKK